MDKLLAESERVMVTTWPESTTILLIEGGSQLQSHVAGSVKLPDWTLRIAEYFVTGRFTGLSDPQPPVASAITSTFPAPAAPQSTVTLLVPLPEAREPPVIVQLYV